MELSSEESGKILELKPDLRLRDSTLTGG